MCIRDGCKEWFAGDMAIEDFRKLSCHLRDVKAVVLEGWGEPLLYGHLIEAVRVVKEAGAQAGFVTSGFGLTRDYARELIQAGVDFMGFSLSGATPKTHDSIRIHSDLESVLQAIGELNRVKQALGSAGPKVHIVYLMLQDNIHEAALVPRIAKEVGVDEVVCINLIQITNPWQEDQRVFSCEVGEESAAIESARAKAKSLGVRFRAAPLSPKRVAVCEEDPLENVYISVRGEVAPCVYLYPPVTSPISRIFCGMERAVPKVSFGNIFGEPFEQIWDGASCREFRQAFVARKRKAQQAYLSTVLSTERNRKSTDFTLPDPPEPCQSCHKILGL